MFVTVQFRIICVPYLKHYGLRYIKLKWHFLCCLLRRIFRPGRKEITGGWRILHLELRILYSLPTIIGVIKLQRLRRTGNVWHICRIETQTVFLSDIFLGRHHLGDISIYGVKSKWLWETKGIHIYIHCTDTKVTQDDYKMWNMT